MSKFTFKDILVFAVFACGAVAVSSFALVGQTGVAVAALGVLFATGGVVARVEFAIRRQDFRAQRVALRTLRSDVRGVQHKVGLNIEAARIASLSLSDRVEDLQRRLVEFSRESEVGFGEVHEDLNRGFRKVRHDGHMIAEMKNDLSADMLALRSEFRGMRVAQQLVTQTTVAMKTDVQASIKTSSAVADDFQGLQQLFGRYLPTAPLPSLADSRLRASGTFFVTDLVEQMQPGCVWHRGSIAPALWMAYAMRRNGHGVVVVEVLSNREASVVTALVTSHGLSEWVDIRVSAEATAANGEYPAPAEWRDEPQMRVDLLVLDQIITDPDSNRQYPTVAELDRTLSTEAIVIVSDAEHPEVERALDSWTAGHERFANVPSPHPDIAILLRGPDTGERTIEFANWLRVTSRSL